MGTEISDPRIQWVRENPRLAKVLAWAVVVTILGGIFGGVAIMFWQDIASGHAWKVIIALVGAMLSAPRVYRMVKQAQQ
jgi:hypothetical protein